MNLLEWMYMYIIENCENNCCLNGRHNVTVQSTPFLFFPVKCRLKINSSEIILVWLSLTHTSFSLCCNYGHIHILMLHIVELPFGCTCVLYTWLGKCRHLKTINHEQYYLNVNRKIIEKWLFPVTEWTW